MIGIRFLVLATLVFVSVASLKAQTVVDEAQQYLTAKDYAAARNSIEQAKADAALGQQARTWYLAGHIYKEIFESAADIYPDSREEALTAFNTCLTKGESENYREDCSSLSQYLLTTYFNDGVNAFNEGNYQVAGTQFDHYIERQIPEIGGDTYGNALFYGGLAAEYLNQKPKAIKRYEEAISYHLPEPSLYSQLAYLYESAGDQANAVRVLDQGGDRFPKDPDLMIARVNIYLGFEKYLAAEPIVDQYLRLFPDDKEVLLVAGTIYQHNKNLKSGSKDSYMEKCKDVYLKVLNNDPENYLANYNLGILIFNQAVDLVKLSEYDITINNLDELINTSNQLFQEALPYIEKANMMKPNNRNALFALAGIYYSMDEKDRLNEIERKLQMLN